MTFVIQVLGGNKSSTEQLNTTQSMIVYYLLEGIKIDLGEIIFKDLLAKLVGSLGKNLYHTLDLFPAPYKTCWGPSTLSLMA